MGYKTKSYTRLIEELNAAHKKIMELRALPGRRNDIVTCKDIMGCFTKASRPGVYYDPSNPGDASQAANTLAAYVRRGYMRYVPRNEGGLGYEVSPQYLLGENAVTTTVVDAEKNLLSKLKPNYASALSFLCDVANISQSTSIGALLELLRKPEGGNYRGLFERLAPRETKPATEEQVAVRSLGHINISYISFAGSNDCKLRDCTLDQAYYIGRALDTRPVKKAEPSLAELVETERVRQEVAKVIERAEADGVLESTDAPSTDAPF